MSIEPMPGNLVKIVRHSPDWRPSKTAIYARPVGTSQWTAEIPINSIVMIIEKSRFVSTGIGTTRGRLWDDVVTVLYDGAMFEVLLLNVKNLEDMQVVTSP